MNQADALPRFLAKVTMGRGPADCWLWTAGRRNGYGRFWFDGRDVYAHRFAYGVYVGPIASSAVIDHLCRNTGCVNPAHLEPVAERTNLLRGLCPTAMNARRVRCVNGHLFNAENTYIESRGRRKCRACNRDQARSRRRNPSAPAEMCGAPKSETRRGTCGRLVLPGTPCPFHGLASEGR